MEASDAKNIDEDTAVPYEPPFGEILGELSTSRIVRVAPDVIIKCPRFAWYYSEKAVEKWFVRAVKGSFEVEERLLHILMV